MMSHRQPSLRPVVVILRAAAQSRRWTAYRLHQETGQTIQTMQRLLTGKGSPTLHTLEAVAKALGMKITALPL